MSQDHVQRRDWEEIVAEALQEKDYAKLQRLFDELLKLMNNQDKARAEADYVPRRDWEEIVAEALGEKDCAKLQRLFDELLKLVDDQDKARREGTKLA